jgi:hypothetical protein
MFAERRTHNDLPDEAGILGFFLFPFAERGPALQNAQVVDEKFSVEMVDLVLQAAGEQSGRSDFLRISVLIQGVNDNALGALDFAVDLRNGKAAFFGFGGSFTLDDTRIYNREPLSLDIHDGDSFGATDLRRRESNSLGCVHRIEHIRDECFDVVGDFGDQYGFFPQYRITENPDVENAHGGEVGKESGGCCWGLCGIAANYPSDPAAFDNDAGFAGSHGDSVFHAGGLGIRLHFANVQYLADDAAGRHDLIAFLERADGEVVFLSLLLTRAQEHEVKNGEDGAVHENRARPWIAANLKHGENCC